MDKFINTLRILKLTFWIVNRTKVNIETCHNKYMLNILNNNNKKMNMCNKMKPLSSKQRLSSLEITSIWITLKMKMLRKMKIIKMNKIKICKITMKNITD